MRKRFVANRSGFTLIELLTAIAIVVIAVSIATPIYMKFFATAKQSEASATLSGIKISEEGYRLAHSTYLNCSLHPVVAPDQLSKAWGSGNVSFNAIGFATNSHIRFVYEVIDSTNEGYTALAHGDTDGDGDTVHFIVTKDSAPHVYNGETLTSAPSVTIDGTPGQD